MQKIQGWVEQGDTTLTISGASGTIARKVQGSFPSATVTAYIANPTAIAISSISRLANVVTVTIVSASGFIAGQPVTIAGVADGSFDGVFTILAAGGSVFTYAQTAASVSSSGGTAFSTLRLATIYADNARTPKANPFTAGADATWFFYVPNGQYDVQFSGGGIATPFTLGALGSIDENSIWADVTASPYFATGNGTTDDTAAIQAALNAVSPGGIVFLPPGVYKCFSTLTSVGAVNLIGSGREVSVLFFVNPGDGMTFTTNSRYAHFTLKGPVSGVIGVGGGFISGNVSDVTFDNMVVENFGTHGINTGATSTRITIQNTIVRGNGDDAILIAGGSTYCQIINCQLYNNGSFGLDFNGSNNIATGNVIKNNGALNPGNGGGVAIFGYVDGINIYSANNNILAGNEILQNAGHGVSVGASGTATANDNVIDGNIVSPQLAPNSGILVGGGGGSQSKRTRILNNTCSGNFIGIFLQILSTTSIDGTEILNNISNNNTLYGIAIDTGTTNTRVLNNTLLGNGTAPILSNGTNTTQAGNITQVSVPSFDVVASNMETGPTYTLGMLLKSAGNTNLQLQSTAGGTGKFSHVIDTSGNWSLIDVTSGSNTRIRVDNAGTVFLKQLAIGINGTAVIHGIVEAVATLDFPSTAAQTASDLTIAMPGAQLGVPTYVSPSPGVWALSGSGFYVAACLANDVVTVRFVNPTVGAIDPISGQFIVLQFNL